MQNYMGTSVTSVTKIFTLGNNMLLSFKVNPLSLVFDIDIAFLQARLDEIKQLMMFLEYLIRCKTSDDCSRIRQQRRHICYLFLLIQLTIVSFTFY